MASINVHAGHNPAYRIACGACGFLNESDENRKVSKEVIRLLREKGHTVYDCTVNNGASANDVLKKICAKCNAHTVDLDVSIHFNAGRNDSKGDNKIGGCEVELTKKIGRKGKAATSICKNLSKLGFTNRGTTLRDKLYYLNHTKAQAILVECCFVDDRDDYVLYKKVTYKEVAKAIANGICEAL